MRVNVQLIDAETGNHLWAERFDKPLTDLFDMQDEIVARLANALDAQLTAAEARRAEQAPNPDSMDLYFQGLAWFNKGVTAENLAQARGFFDRALIADPGNVDALIDLARADVYAAALFFAPDPEASFAAAEAKLTRALSSVPDHARGHIWLGFVDIFTRRAAQGIAECEHALALDRNLASAHAIIGLGKVFVGRAEETEAHVLEAFRLSPRDMMAYTWMTYAAIAKNILGSYDLGGRLVSTGGRGQSKSPDSLVSVGHRARVAHATGRGAFRSRDRPRARARLHCLPRPPRLDRVQRRRHIFDPGRGSPRRPAQGRGP